MSDRIVFLNLADMDENGLVQSSKRNLENKFKPKTFIDKVKQKFIGGVNIEIIDLFSLIAKKRAMAHSSVLFGMKVQYALQYEIEACLIREKCKGAKKILLGAHGRVADTERVFKALGWGKGSGPAGTYDELAVLMSDLLYPDRAYKLGLIICYGARSENYLKHHELYLDKKDIKSSFAYKFFKRLCELTTADVIMTARTGAVLFNSDGTTAVEMESFVRMAVELSELKKELAYKSLAESYEKLVEHYHVTNKTAELFDMQKRMAIQGSIPTNDAEAVIKKIHVVAEKNNAIQMNVPLEKGKYGKFVYIRNNNNTVSVLDKYGGDKGEPVELYRGPF